MNVDGLTERLRRVIVRYQDGLDSDLLFAEGVTADLAEARAAAGRRPPLNVRQNRRRSTLHHVAGWLHFHRYSHFADADLDGTDDLLASMRFLAPLAHRPEAVPPPMRVLIGPARRPDDLVRLAQALRHRPRCTVESADAAVELLADALDLADDAARPSTMAELGIAIRDRVLLAAEPDEQALATAVELCRAAVAAEPLPRHREKLGHVLSLHGHVTGAPESGDEAVAAFQVLAAGPDPSAAALGNLGLAHLTRYRVRADGDHLDRAVDHLTAAVERPWFSPAERGRAQLQLAGALRDRAGRDASVLDLDTAVEIAESALAVAADDAHFELALSLLARYGRRGESADLDRAFEVATAAAEVEQMEWLTLLGDLHEDRFVRDEDADDLAAAVDLARRALAAVGPRHSQRAELASRLTMRLSLSLRMRHVKTRSVSRLARAARTIGAARTNTRSVDRAIALLSDLVETIPGSGDRSACLSNLGACWHTRFDVTRRAEDLDNAVDCLRRAVAVPPPSPVGLLVATTNLVDAVAERWRLTASHEDRAALAAVIARPSPAPQAPSTKTMRYHQVLGSAALAIGDAGAAVRLLDAAIAGLPTTLPRLGRRVDSELRLTGSLGLASEAVEAYCRLGDPAGAVAAVESCRAQLLSLRLDLEDDPAALASVGTAAATAFTQARDRLRAAPADRASWADFEAAVHTIREQPGLHRFPLPADPDAHRPTGTDQAIVLLTSWRDHGRAVIVPGRGDIVDLRLPGLSRRAAQRHTGAFLDAGSEPGPVLPGLLAWLWAEAVAPVLDVVRDRTGSAMPRVWWTPCDLMSLLPVHAAQPLDGPGCLDAAVSSYAPTLRLLRRARSARPAAERSILGVAVPNAPGGVGLVDVVREVEDLAGRYPEVRSLIDPDRGQFAAALPGTSWLHFAGHASLHERSPGAAALHLADGPFSLDAVAGTDLSQADLAYLSACSTGQRGWRHADEATHLASAFHVAGFRHVISSLWPVNDAIARIAARAFYAALPESLVPGSHAAALRTATLELRAVFDGRPGVWAPFIHSGP